MTNNENVSTGYQQVGNTTVYPASQPGYSVTMTPITPPGLPLGGSASSLQYTVSVVPYGGFNGTVTFSQQQTPPPPNEFAVSINPPSVTGAGSATLTITTTSSSVNGSGAVGVNGSSPGFPSITATTNYIYVADGPPVVADSTPPGTGASQLFTVTATDPTNAKEVDAMNLLIAPVLDGRHACWVFYNSDGLWLADDNGASWTFAGAIGSASTASNSQCTVGGAQGSVNPTNFTTGSTRILTLSIPVQFSGAFTGGKTVFLRASNLAGFDSGYQPSGGWTVP